MKEKARQRKGRKTVENPDKAKAKTIGNDKTNAKANTTARPEQRKRTNAMRI